MQLVPTVHPLGHCAGPQLDPGPHDVTHEQALVQSKPPTQLEVPVQLIWQEAGPHVMGPWHDDPPMHAMLTSPCICPAVTPP